MLPEKLSGTVVEACRFRFDAVLVDDAQELDQVAANLYLCRDDLFLEGYGHAIP